MKFIALVMLFASAVFGQISSIAASQSACGPLDTKFKIKTTANQQPLAEPAPDKALVYVIEDQKFKAVNDVTARVGLDGTWVGANRGNSYLSFEVPAGEHHLCTDWTSDFLPNGRVVSLSSLKAEAGKVYFFRARTTGGPGSVMESSGLQSANGASIDLVQVDPDEGKRLVTSSALSVSYPKK